MPVKKNKSANSPNSSNTNSSGKSSPAGKLGSKATPTKGQSGRAGKSKSTKLIKDVPRPSPPAKSKASNNHSASKIPNKKAKNEEEDFASSFMFSSSPVSQRATRQERGPHVPTISFTNIDFTADSSSQERAHSLSTPQNKKTATPTSQSKKSASATPTKKGTNAAPTKKGANATTQKKQKGAASVQKQKQKRPPSGYNDTSSSPSPSESSNEEEDPFFSFDTPEKKAVPLATGSADKKPISTHTTPDSSKKTSPSSANTDREPPLRDTVPFVNSLTRLYEDLETSNFQLLAEKATATTTRTATATQKTTASDLFSTPPPTPALAARDRPLSSSTPKEKKKAFSVQQGSRGRSMRRRSGDADAEHPLFAGPTEEELSPISNRLLEFSTDEEKEHQALVKNKTRRKTR